MSFLFPHTITIDRPEGQTTAGAHDYSSMNEVTYTRIATNIPCNIRIARTGVERGDLPAATAYTTFYYIVAEAPESYIRTRDVVTDHNGRRYQVTGHDWGSLGHQFLCELLEN